MPLSVHLRLVVSGIPRNELLCLVDSFGVFAGLDGICNGLQGRFPRIRHAGMTQAPNPKERRRQECQAEALEAELADQLWKVSKRLVSLMKETNVELDVMLMREWWRQDFGLLR